MVMQKVKEQFSLEIGQKRMLILGRQGPLCLSVYLQDLAISPLTPIKTSIPTDGDEHFCILVSSQSCVLCNHSAAGIAMSLPIYLPVSPCWSLSSQDRDQVLLIFALFLLQVLALRPGRKQNSQKGKRERHA